MELEQRLAEIGIKMELEQRLAKIDDRLEEIDSEIHRLSSLKQKLKREREKLIDTKNFSDSTDLSAQDWSNGKFSILIAIIHN